MAEPATGDIVMEPLERLLAAVHDGRIQVPEFQRELSLDDDGVKCLPVSVSMSYPIGAVKLLQCGSNDVRFQARAVTGAASAANEPERLLLDGQHRVSALYQVLASGRAVQIDDERGERLQRWYYIDIDAALDPDADRDEAIVSVPEPLRVELEWEHRSFPLRLVFGGDVGLRRWKHGFAEHNDSVRDRWDGFEAEVLNAFRGYLLPTIIVGKEQTRWAVRVHGGAEGRNLSDQFRVTDSEEGRHTVTRDGGSRSRRGST
jgi:hypothetical protein